MNLLDQTIKNERPVINSTVKSIGIVEFLSMELPERQQLLSPWLPAQGLVMIHAYRGTGKTHVALGIGVAVASGGMFLKWSAPSPAGVLLLDGEMSARVLQERLAEIIHNCKVAPSAPLRIITPDLQEFGMPNLTNDQGQKDIEAHLDGISLVIVDNISTLCKGGRENEAESWLPVQGWALRLRARGISVLFIHHSGKGGLQRGTSRREDVLDTVISLRQPPGYQPDQGACFEVHFEKSRGCQGEDVKPFMTSLKDGLWTMKDLEVSLTEKVAEMLNNGWERREIAKSLGKNKSTISRHENKARELGLLRRTS